MKEKPYKEKLFKYQMKCWKIEKLNIKKSKKFVGNLNDRTSYVIHIKKSKQTLFKSMFKTSLNSKV